MKTTKDWLEFHLKESERFQNLILNQTLNDASALGGALSRLVLRGKTERPSGVVLSGPSGSGKHHAANHILQALDLEDCAPVFLTGASLAEGVSGFFELAERINALLDEFYDREQGVCIVLEEPDECGYSGQLYPFLGRIAHEYKDNPDELPALFLILIAKEPPVLPSILRDLLLCCACTLPDPEKRRAFIDDRASALKHYVDLNELAEATDGCSYAAIAEVVRSLEFLVDTTDRAPDSETIRRLIREAAPELLQKAAPEPRRESSAEKRTTVSEIRPELAPEHLREPVPEIRQEITPELLREFSDPVVAAIGRLEVVFSEISDRLSKIKLGGAMAVQSDQPNALDLTDIPAGETQSITPDRDKFEEMSVHQLAVELFGEERVDALVQN